MIYFIVLVGNHILYRVIYAESSYKKGSTAADTDDHHKEAFLVAEDIPHGNLT